MGRITLADLAQDEVELPGGHVYTIAPATKAVIKKASAFHERLQALGESPDADIVAEIYCELLDVRLVSVEKGQPRASTVMKRLWETDKVTIPQLLRLLEDVGASDRPT